MNDFELGLFEISRLFLVPVLALIAAALGMVLVEAVQRGRIAVELCLHGICD